MTYSPSHEGVFRRVLHLLSMTTTFDFQVQVRTDFPGLSYVVAQNEDAFSYLTEEEELPYTDDDSVLLPTSQVGEFFSDAEHAHFSAALV